MKIYWHLFMIGVLIGLFLGYWL